VIVVLEAIEHCGDHRVAADERAFCWIAGAKPAAAAEAGARRSPPVLDRKRPRRRPGRSPKPAAQVSKDLSVAENLLEASHAHHEVPLAVSHLFDGGFRVGLGL
jgi:hypothetical protein